MRRHHPPILRALAGALLCALAGTVVAQQAAPPAAPPAAAKDPSAYQIQLVKDPRALAALKAMSDRLASAKSFTVRAENTVPMLGPNLQWISLVGTARVALDRPNGLFIARGGDQPSLEVYYDGRTLVLHEPAEKLYAEVAAPATVDATLAEVFGPAVAGFPYLAVLMSDPYASLTKDLGGALYVGHSTLDGVKTEHLAMRSPGVDWEIWIGAEDRLPRLVQAKYVDLGKAPMIMTRFHDWNLNPQIPAATFRLEKAATARQIEYVKPEPPVTVPPKTGK
jgi:hypothetical protein